MQLAILTPSNRDTPIWPQAFAAALVRWYENVYEGCRIVDRHSGRRRSACKCSTGQDICGNDSDFDFRRSTGFVWTDRFPHPHFAMIHHIPSIYSTFSYQICQEWFQNGTYHKFKIVINNQNLLFLLK